MAVGTGSAAGGTTAPGGTAGPTDAAAACAANTTKIEVQSWWTTGGEATGLVLTSAEEKGVTLREAAYLIAVERVARAQAARVSTGSALMAMSTTS